LAGYPGSIASTWQQIGRSGRRGTTSIAIVVATGDPMDQFVIQHPDYFFAQPPEFARIDADNLRVAVEHLKCACYELPWEVGESYGAFDAEETEEMLEFLAHETGMMQRGAEQWRWSERDYPASSVHLRNIAEENFVVVDVTHGRQEILAEVDFESAHTTLYPHAVYQVSGRPYRVERLDYDERRAYVRASDDDHYTTATQYTAVRVLETLEEDLCNQAHIGFGEVCVTRRLVGYKKIRFGTGEHVGYGALHLPQLDLHTMSYWVTLPSRHFEDAHDPHVWARMVQGLGTVLETAAALKLMCDPQDLCLCIGSVSEDTWLTKSFEGWTTRSTSDADQGLSAQGRREGPVAPALHNPTLFLYDRFPGGVGFGEGLFEEHLDFMRRAYDLVHDCACAHGCPSCVGPPELGERPVRRLVERVLMRLMIEPAAQR
ncbi:MAG: Zn-binding domain-containing protein, partial [Myxococcota bacterium]